jgi:Fe-S cluster assembly iron-binding protein IscA
MTGTGYTEHNTDIIKNVNTIEVTPKAIRLLKDFFKGKDIKPIRIFVKLGGCGIRSFGVAVEKRKKNDEVFSVNGFTFIIEKGIWEKVKPIQVDADSIFFRISGSGIQPNNGCGTCSYMCGLNGTSRCSGDCVNCSLPCSHGQRVRGK